MVLHTKIAWDSQDFRALAPYVYAPGYLATDRWDPVADLLVSRGYFDRGYKLGIVSIEEPAAQRLVTRFERRLARHGIRVTDKANVGTGNGYDWVGQVGSQTSSMVLRFKTSGITHVLFLGTYTSASYFFPTYAESQGYRPRYAYTSTEMPSYTEKNEPAAQLARSVAVGWRPTLDVNPPQDPKDNANEQLCLRVVHRAGIETNDRVAENSVLGVCEFLLFLKQGLEGAPELSPAGLRARVDRLGSGFASSQTPRTLFAPGRYDGVAALRWVAFDSACACFRYSGRWRDLS